MIGMPGVILKLRNCDFLKLLDALWVSIRGSFIHPWRVYGYLVSTVKLSLFCILNRRVHQRQEEVFQERGGVHKEELWKEAKWLRWYLKLPPDLNVLLSFMGIEKLLWQYRMGDHTILITGGCDVQCLSRILVITENAISSMMDKISLVFMVATFLNQSSIFAPHWEYK